LALTTKVSAHLKGSGYFYVEVPQELSDEEIVRLAEGDRSISVPIHEHINRFTPSSVAHLFESAGLALVDKETAFMDFGWTKATIIRALGRKR